MHNRDAVPHPPGTNNIAFQRKQFVAERIGWIAMGAALLWALVGGFGEGLISHKRSSNPGETCSIAYERFGRRDAPMQLRVTFSPLPPGDNVTLHFNRAFLDSVKLQRVTPDYQAMIGDREGASLVFEAMPADEDHQITIEYKPEGIGPLPIEVKPSHSAAMTIHQFIYP